MSIVITPTREESIEAQRNAKIWADEIEARAKRYADKNGTWSQMQSRFEAQMLKFRTCDLCGNLCRSHFHLDNKHRGSRECEKQQSANKGVVFVPPGKQQVVCGCGKTVFAENLHKHQQTESHKKRLDPKKVVTCEICGIRFDGKRPLRDYRIHCKKSLRHKQNAAKLPCTLVV
jgi:hypothetical protein